MNTHYSVYEKEIFKKMQFFNACFTGNVELATQLIETVNLNEKYDKKGQTALMFAVENNNKEIIELLFKNGIDRSSKNNKGETAYDIACKKNNIPIMFLFNPDIINKHDAEFSFLHGTIEKLKVTLDTNILIKACQDKNEDNILFLIEKGFDMFIENSEGDSGYKILNRKRVLPPKLQSLKESLSLMRIINNEQDINFSL